MSLQLIKNRIISLSNPHKLMLAGSLLVLISMFLPVYSEMSQWGKGVLYIGISGPLFLAGFSIIILSLLPIIKFLEPSLNWKFKKLKYPFESLAFFSSLQTIFLLILMSSIFLNNEFGVDISVKELRIGIILAFIGAFSALTGIYLFKKSYVSEQITEENSFITLPDQVQDRVHQVLSYTTEDQELKSKIPERKQIIDRSEKELTKENYTL